MQHNLSDLRKQLLANGYLPIPNFSKHCYFRGFNNPAVMGPQWDSVETWPDRFTATGVLIGDGLVAVDLDILDADMIDKLWDQIRDIAPDIADRAPMRYGNKPKLALFARMADGEELFKLLQSRHYLIEKDDKKSHFVEIYGGARTNKDYYSKQFGAYGPHTINKKGVVEIRYSWDGDRGLFEVPFKDLPVITKQQCNAICSAFDRLAEAAGWTVRPPVNDGKTAKFIYDIDADTKFEMEKHKGGGTKTYDDLCIGDRCSTSFYDPRPHERDDSCRVMQCEVHNCIGVFDYKIDGWHLPKSLKPIEQLNGHLLNGASFKLHDKIDISTGSFKRPFVLPDQIPQREFLYARRLARKCVSATVAPGGTGKTSLILAEALAMVSGKPLLGVNPPGKLKVWVWSLEDSREELTRRIMAIARHYGLTKEDIGGGLSMNMGNEDRLVITRKNKDQTELNEELIDMVVNEINRESVDVVIIDPFIGCHAVPENDNSGIDATVKQWLAIATRGNCAVELVHHVRKGEKEVTVESARGGGAFGDACRMVRVINRMTSDEGKTIKILDEEHRRYFRTYIDKNNLAPPVAKSDWFKLVSVDLKQGDHVGVVEPWTYPDLKDEFKTINFELVADAMAGGQWCRDIRTKQAWVGHVIARVLTLDVKQSAGWIKALIKYWIDEKCLAEVVRYDQDTRKNKNFVEAK